MLVKLRPRSAQPARGGSTTGTWTLASAPATLRSTCRKVGAAAFALAGQSGGIALDMLGFIMDSPDDLVPRSR